MQQALPRIGFIGLGAMGHPMAGRIANAGYRLAVLDADEERTASAAKALQVTPATSAAALAAQSDVVVTMLPNSAIVGDVLNGPEGVLAGLAPGGLILEMSSGVPDVTMEFAAAAEEKGIALLDAPVSGGVPRARTGELAIMVGGGDEAFARAKPVLETMGTAIRTGSVGNRPCHEGAEQSRERRRFPDRHRGAFDRFAFRARSLTHGRCPQCLDRHEQFHPEEIQAIRTVPEIRCRLRPRPDGQGSRNRHGRCRNDGNDGAAGRSVPRALARCAEIPRTGTGPHGFGAVLRNAGGERTNATLERDGTEQ